MRIRWIIALFIASLFTLAGCVSTTPAQPTPLNQELTTPTKTTPDSTSAAELAQTAVPEHAPTISPTPEPTSVVVSSMQTQVIVAVPGIHSISDLNGKKLGMNASVFQYALKALNAYDIECIPVAIPSSEEFKTSIPQKVYSLEEIGASVWKIAPTTIQEGGAVWVKDKQGNLVQTVLALTPEQQQANYEAQQNALSLLQSEALIEPGGGIKQEAFELAIKDGVIRQALYDAGLSGKQVSEGMEFVKKQKFWLGLQYGIYDAVLIGNHPLSDLQDMLNSASIQILPWSDQAIQAVTDQFPEAAATVLPSNAYSGQDSDILGFTISQ